MTEEAAKTCKECGRPVHTHSRCTPVHLSKHRVWSNEYRRGRRADLIPDDARESICQMVAEGATVDEAAEAHELRPGQVRGLARAEEQFRVDLDEALLRGRDPGLAHGRDNTYRKYRCRCPECRAAHDETRRGARYASESARYAMAARRRRETMTRKQ